MSLDALQQAFDFFVDNQAELVDQYGGRVIAIKGHDVVGVFDDELSAVRATSEQHELGTFIVQRCEPGPACYTVAFHGCHVRIPAAS